MAYRESKLGGNGYQTNQPASLNTTAFEMDEETDVLILLYDALEKQPSSVHIHERLLEVWTERGNESMASGIASALIKLDQRNGAARRYLRGRQDEVSGEASSARHVETVHSQKKEEDILAAEKSLEKDYASFKIRAKLLKEEIKAVHALGGNLPDEEVISNLQAISDGDFGTAIQSLKPLPVRNTARTIMATPEGCQELIVEDFESFARWSTCQNPPMAVDELRERLVKRKTLLEAALPDSMQQRSTAAFIQIERKYLRKRYANSETMLGDRIEDIPTQNFFVSEDNYAWDMEELSQAITANAGVMRNPLSRLMFTESDIRMMLAHPLGQGLKPLQLAQSQLKKGVRPATIDRIEKLGRIMLADQSLDVAPCREAVDEFQAYVATMPEQEQKTINSLKIPAKDGHSGQPFDYTIGESVRDAKSNITCFHKVGDFLSQAAVYLRNQ